MVEEAFKKYYGKLFAEDKAKDQIKWHGSSMSSLMAQLRRHPSWTGFKYLRSELREQPGIESKNQTRLWIYEIVGESKPKHKHSPSQSPICTINCAEDCPKKQEEEVTEQEECTCGPDVEKTCKHRPRWEMTPGFHRLDETREPLGRMG
jgi:hypothetical protein